MFRQPVRRQRLPLVSPQLLGPDVSLLRVALHYVAHGRPRVKPKERSVRIGRLTEAEKSQELEAETPRRFSAVGNRAQRAE